MSFWAQWGLHRRTCCQCQKTAITWVNWANHGQWGYSNKTFSGSQFQRQGNKKHRSIALQTSGSSVTLRVPMCCFARLGNEDTESYPNSFPNKDVAHRLHLTSIGRASRQCRFHTLPWHNFFHIRTRIRLHVPVSCIKIMVGKFVWDTTETGHCILHLYRNIQGFGAVTRQTQHISRPNKCWDGKFCHLKRIHSWEIVAADVHLYHIWLEHKEFRTVFVWVCFAAADTFKFAWIRHCTTTDVEIYCCFRSHTWLAFGNHYAGKNQTCLHAMPSWSWQHLGNQYRLASKTNSKLCGVKPQLLLGQWTIDWVTRAGHLMVQ